MKPRISKLSNRTAAPIALLSVALISGCGGAGNADAPVVTPAGEGKSATANEADVSPLLDELTQTLRKFSAEKQRVPGSLDELVTAGYLPSLPEAPSGKRFVINPSKVEVILADK